MRLERAVEYFEDFSNIFVLAALMGIGVFATVVVLFLYMAALAIMQEVRD